MGHRQAVLNRILPLLFMLCLGLTATARAQEFDWAPSLPVGAGIPLLEAPDQNGEVQTLASLTGDRGLLLMFSRSFDWCPYCKAQLANLTAVSGEFIDLGLNVVTITYDPVDTLKAVGEDLDVDFTMLHDDMVKHVNAFGILNTDYEPGHFAYGIPQPGIFLLSPDGTIRFKFAEEDYRVRPDFADVLAAARQM